MYISNRAKLITSGVLLVLAVILLLLFWPKRVVTPKPSVNTNTQTNSQGTVTPPAPKPTPVVTPEGKSQASAETVAKIFAERYGSYSSESEAANLEDLLPLVTAPFASELKKQIAQIQSAAIASAYYGVSTHVLNATATTIDTTSGLATYTLLTQREEAKGTLSNTSVMYQTLTLTLAKEGEDWLVAGADWE